MNEKINLSQKEKNQFLRVYHQSNQSNKDILKNIFSKDFFNDDLNFKKYDNLEKICKFINKSSLNYLTEEEYDKLSELKYLRTQCYLLNNKNKEVTLSYINLQLIHTFFNILGSKLIDDEPTKLYKIEFHKSQDDIEIKSKLLVYAYKRITFDFVHFMYFNNLQIAEFVSEIFKDEYIRYMNINFKYQTI